jgi:excisionase family DNA binding protein
MASPQHLTVEQVAERLHLSVWTVRDKARRRQLPHRKPPGTRRLIFPLTDIEAYEDGCADFEFRRWGSDGRIVAPPKV